LPRMSPDLDVRYHRLLSFDPTCQRLTVANESLMKVELPPVARTHLPYAAVVSHIPCCLSSRPAATVEKSARGSWTGALLTSDLFKFGQELGGLQPLSF
jgi:hypothetical protein